MNKYLLYLIIFSTIIFSSSLPGNDWPIYKGNLYFTGNNDEIIIKNNNLKWLFQADSRVHNPIVSDGRVYFIDSRARLYCVKEENGKLIWKIDVNKISVHFKSLSRAAGKIKYPIIKGNILFLSDPVAIYAINKITGRVIWARTGMRLNHAGSNNRFSKYSRPMIDSIYANPAILNDQIFYGTRKMFISREINNGHLKWNNNSIHSYSGFPTYYDNIILTQSMNYNTGIYKILCLEINTGNEKWAAVIEKPMKIFSPVVYKRRVYIPTGKKIYCLNLNNGEIIWAKKYKGYITSNPSFTERAILFSLDNSNVVVIDPLNGNIKKTIKVSPKSSPYFVTIRDQIYIAYNKYDMVSKKRHPYAKLGAINFSNNKKLWTFKPPFPGAVSQPVASGGIIFLPAGNYIYAIGTEYYEKIIDGGSGFIIKPDKKGGNEKPPVRKADKIKKEKPQIKKKNIEITDKKGRGLPAYVEVKKRKKGKIVFKKIYKINGSGKIEIPKGNGVEIVITSKGYVPKKIIINNDDKIKKIELDKIEPGKSVVIDNIQFEFGKAYLKKKSLDILYEFIKLLKKNPMLKFEVRGFTDNLGAKKFNQKLSERRADSVREYLIKNGISPERIQSRGYGEKNPIASNKSRKGRRKNRRTEFLFK